MGNTFTPLSLFQSQAQPTTPDYTGQELIAPQMQGQFVNGYPTLPYQGQQPGGYAQQLQAMLAPYQQMAARMYSPYATMSPNSWLAQNHPGLAGRLDNALLVAANIHGGATIGDNISGVAQGLVAANQFHRQQQMMQQMLPYQMLEPQIKLQDQIAQIQERQSEIPYRQAMEQRSLAQADWYARRLQEPNAADLQMKIAMGMVNPKDPNNLTQEEFVKLGEAYDKLAHPQRPSSGNPNADFTASGIARRLDSPDPAVRAQAEIDQQRYISTQGQIAGTRTGAEQNVRIPQADVDREIKEYQDSRVYDKPMSFKDYSAMKSKDIIDPWNAMTDAQRTKEYQNYFQTTSDAYNRNRTIDNNIINGYRAAARKNPSLTISQFLQQSASGPTTGGAGPSAPPPGSRIRIYNPKTGTLE